jgi:hypothetical protein
MGKVRRLVALIREKKFLLSFAASFAGFLGATSAVLSITGIQFQIGTAILIIVGALGLSVAIHLRHCYVASVTIEPEIYEQLRVKNPYILACLTDRRGKFLGYFDAIPLEASFANAFLKGTVTEAQITHEDVLRPEKMHLCKYLFIAGLAVAESTSYAGKRNANILVWALLRYLAHFYSTAKPVCFAVAATKEGDHLLQRFNVSLRSEAITRADRYRLYSIELNREQITNRLGYLPDWQLLCTLDWKKTNRQDKRRAGPARPILSNTKPRHLENRARPY